MLHLPWHLPSVLTLYLPLHLPSPRASFYVLSRYVLDSSFTDCKPNAVDRSTHPNTCGLGETRNRTSDR